MCPPSFLNYSILLNKHPPWCDNKTFTILHCIVAVAESKNSFSTMFRSIVNITSTSGTPISCVYMCKVDLLQMLPYKNEVIQSLETCLDDKKRLVRKEAVKSRSSW